MSRLSPRVSQFAELRRAGASYEEIGEAMGISRQTIYHYAAQAQVTRVYEAFEAADDDGDAETPREARARVGRELADGTRCGHRLGLGVCCLLKPCDDHEAT